MKISQTSNVNTIQYACPSSTSAQKIELFSIPQQWIYDFDDDQEKFDTINCDDNQTSLNEITEEDFVSFEKLIHNSSASPIHKTSRDF